MTYVSLGSMEATEALGRMLEKEAVAKVAKGLLQVGEVLDMAEHDAIAAFQFVRFADTNGVPVCARCGSGNSLAIPSRRRWRCRVCRNEFTVTSGTMLHGRKMGFRAYLSLLSLILDKTQFRSLLQFTKATGMDYKTALGQVRNFRAAAIDHKGCTVPFSLLLKPAFNERVAATNKFLGRFIALQKKEKAPRRNIAPLMNYPYLNEGNSGVDGADLIAFVNGLVPRSMPDYMRADICQDMILSILSGQATREGITRDSRAFLAKIFAEYPWKYKWMSFDAPLHENGMSMHDIMSEDDDVDAQEWQTMSGLEGVDESADLLY